MIFNSIAESATLITSLFVALSSFSIWRCYRENRFLSALSGLHANTFIMVGFGPLVYVHFPLSSDRFFHVELLTHLVDGSWPMLIGYTIWVVLETVLISRSGSNLLGGVRTSQQSRNFFGVLATVGYFGCTFEFAQYGVGTIFPVLKNFVYPALLLTLLNIDLRRSISNVLPDIVLVVLMSLISFYSPWRSEMIMLFIYLLIALYLRFARFRIILLLLGTMGILIIVPFVQYKKQHYDAFQESPLSAVIDSQSISLSDRADLLSEFSAIRLNSLRELAHVIRALENGELECRYGKTYEEAMLQLVPRVLWPEKPNYNNLSNRVIPRQIGLVGREDASTSWGVNLFAEFAYNFPRWNLVWFVSLIFFLFSRLDQINLKLYASSQTRLICACTLFSMMFTVVGLLNLTTFILWNFLVLKIIDSFASQNQS